MLKSETIVKFLESKKYIGDLSHYDQQDFKKSYETKIAFLLNSHYYLSIFPDEYKNTTEKAVNLFSINKNLNSAFFTKEVQDDITYIKWCMDNNYPKATHSNPALKNPYRLMVVLDSFLSKDDFGYIAQLPKHSFEAIQNDQEISSWLFEILCEKVSAFKTLYKQFNFNTNNTEQEIIIHSIERNGNNLARFIRSVVHNFHKALFDERLFNLLISLKDLTNDYQEIAHNNERLDHDLTIYQTVRNITGAIFTSSFFNKFSLSVRKPYEEVAIYHNCYNFNRATKATRLKHIYDVAKIDFNAIGFTRLYGKTQNYPVLAKCLELAIEGLTQTGRDRLEPTHSEPDSQIKELMREAGVYLGEMKYMGFTPNDLQAMLRTIRMKVISEKLPEKNIRQKVKKI